MCENYVKINKECRQFTPIPTQYSVDTNTHNQNRSLNSFGLNKCSNIKYLHFDRYPAAPSSEASWSKKHSDTETNIDEAHIKPTITIGLIHMSTIVTFFLLFRGSQFLNVSLQKGILIST